MPKLSQHQSNKYTKMLIVGDPGTGKTGCCASLVKADYHLGIIDLDNGLDAFKQFVIRDCPDKIDNVHYVTFRDKKVPGPNGPIVEGPARAYLDAVKMTERWKDGDVDLGQPWKWGPDHILIMDSGTFLAQAAFDWREQMVSGKPGKYDQRAVYYDAQKSVSSLFATLTGEAFRTNVIIITHLRYQEAEDGLLKGYPNTIGQALSTMIGAYFNTIVLCQATQGGKRVIRTLSTQQVDLKNPKPFAMGHQYPIETGLAEIFKTLQGPPEPMEVVPPPKPTPPQSALVKPKQLQLKRI